MVKIYMFYFFMCKMIVFVEIIEEIDVDHFRMWDCGQIIAWMTFVLVAKCLVCKYSILAMY